MITDPLLLMLSTSHPLADRPSVSLEDLGDCVVPQVGPATPSYWEEAVHPFHTPSGRPIPRGPTVTTFQEIQAVVAANQAVCVVFAEAYRYYQRPGITYRPIHDAPQGQWALIWRNAPENTFVQAFTQAAHDIHSPR